MASLLDRMSARPAGPGRNDRPPAGSAEPSRGAVGKASAYHLSDLKFRLLAEAQARLGGNLEEQREEELRTHLESLLSILPALSLQGSPEAFQELSPEDQEVLIKSCLDEVYRCGPLQPLLEDPVISKINVLGPHEVLVTRLGRQSRADCAFNDTDHLLRLLKRMAGWLNTRLDETVCKMERKLPDGSRVTAVIPPLSGEYPTLSIEKYAQNPFQLLARMESQAPESQKQAFYDLEYRIWDQVLAQMDESMLQQNNPTRVRQWIEETVLNLLAPGSTSLTRDERNQIVWDITDEVLGYGPIQCLLDDPTVSEIMVNGPKDVYVERGGKLILTNRVFRDDEHVLRIIDKIVTPLGRSVNEATPMVDARLPDGSRVNAVVPPISFRGPTLTIRKFSKDKLTADDLVRFGTLTPLAVEFLRACVLARFNILICGGTGSGKTTTLNVLSSFVPADQRIITVEDTVELQLQQPHVITLEARPPNLEGVGEITIRDLVRNCLRMRPDRIIVGEVRGAEALDMLQAMNTGHDGSLCTCHANSPRDALARLETMVLMAGTLLPTPAIRSQIVSALDLIVHQERMSDGSRRVTAITEVQWMEGDVIVTQDVFAFKRTGTKPNGDIIGELRPTGLRPALLADKLEDAGLSLPEGILA
jgi:pilus assembly protein CpaF